MLVAIGGAVGCIARYLCSAAAMHFAATWRFPLGTFIVNVAGCFAAGLLIGLAENHDFLTRDLRLLLFTGLLGGYTTFSAFGVETVSLIEKGEWSVAAAYVVSSVLVGLAGLWIAVKLGGTVGAP